MLDDIDIAALSARPGVKWARARAGGAIPAWIADMDFPAPEPVRAALSRAAEADLGYPVWEEDPLANPLIDAYVERTSAKYGHRPDPAGIRFFTEMIQALQAILHLTTAPGDAVAMHTPGYPPFLETIAQMGRRLVPIPMIDTGSGWTFDPAPVASCRVLILVNPQNPTGRVFTRDELSEIAALAEKHDVLVIADEIHAELIYEPHRHITFASLAPGRTVTLASASKAFNLAGLRCAIADVAVPSVRKALDTLPPLMLGQPGTLGIVGTLAAWEHGEPWLAEVRGLLDRNRRLVAEALPGHHRPEATYLAWLDLRELGPDPAARILAETQVMLSPGPQYGPGGEGYARLNFGTSRPVLEEILRRLGTYRLRS
ncbi:aminotransferase class I/II-fold pyridoxal phosphate-dependent enzyme [Actinoplanes sp. NEAU-A12]|uniref:cysteine-S-conjugate beta-lyase n=1 Tax=Actinoplanes sandaracinus TaxID=3045177 RepID=A0ABT6WRF1_9ACTN|nr:aminotransferase class I/II-fold pyridoxal phosphate-dependent enzyme [Actinoplanes sandaracinus]MDI6102322.1 aminotransferase class I/II-fold pyridoxal phosphate-dependent enzyme [Actinoplanes sandaracinus]